MGIKKIAHLTSIAPNALIDRFGKPLGRQLRIAFGLEDEVLEPIREFFPLRLETVFPGPSTNPTAIEQTLSKLLERALQTLDEKNFKVRSLTIELHRVRSFKETKTVPLNFPSSNFKHIWSLLKPRIERCNLGYGVEAVILIIPRKEYFYPKRFGLWDEFCGDDLFERDFGELVNSLRESLGKEQILAPEFIASHIPEKSFHYSAELKRKEIPREERPQDHPSLLFSAPRPIRAMSLLPDRPPHWIEWRGQQTKIQHGFGPERIAPEWWQAQPYQTRDYFKVQTTSGTWLWVFRELETSRWFLHGLWA